MMDTSSTVSKPDIDSFIELVHSRRSVRTGYLENVDVPEEHIMKILEAARWAPSGGNGQPWEFIIIKDKETRNKIVELFQRQLISKSEIQIASRNPASFSSGAGFKNAPVYIVVLGDSRVSRSYPVRTALEKSDSHFYSGLANTSIIIQLAAESLGLSTQWLSDVSSPWFSTMLKRLLGIPEQMHVYHLIPIGYSNNRPKTHYRRPLERMIHRERYDLSKYRSDEEFDRLVIQRSGQNKSD